MSDLLVDVCLKLVVEAVVLLPVSGGLESVGVGIAVTGLRRGLSCEVLLARDPVPIVEEVGRHVGAHQ